MQAVPASYVVGAAAALLIAATWAYVALAWRRAPKASRALKFVAAANLAAGLVIGVLVSGVIPEVGPIGLIGAPGSPTAGQCLPDTVPVTELGKAIVLNDQKQAGNPNWESVASEAELCREGAIPEGALECRGAFLGRHALGLDLKLGDQRTCIPDEEIAELCGPYLPARSAVCKQAFNYQRRKMKR